MEWRFDSPTTHNTVHLLLTKNKNIMKDFNELSDQEMFDCCANKSLSEIKDMEDEEYQRQAVRYYLSRLLMNNDDSNPLLEDKNGNPLYVLAETEEDCGLSTNDKMHIVGFSQTACEGFINVLIEGCSEWDDIDMFTPKEQVWLLENLLKVI